MSGSLDFTRSGQAYALGSCGITLSSFLLPAAAGNSALRVVCKTSTHGEEKNQYVSHGGLPCIFLALLTPNHNQITWKEKKSLYLL